MNDICRASANKLSLWADYSPNDDYAGMQRLGALDNDEAMINAR